MDTIILAAGANERLRGIVAPYHKPLLLAAGKPLIRQLVEDADNIQWGGGTTVVVVSPGNASAIIGVLSDGTEYLKHTKLRYVIQPFPSGPVHALQLALPMTLLPSGPQDGIRDRLLMLCADNIIPTETWDNLRGALNIHERAPITIGVQTVEAAQASRFTTIHAPGEWDPSFHDGVPEGDLLGQACWVGPVVFRASMIAALMAKACGRSHSFAQVFNAIVQTSRPEHGPHVSVFKSTALDIGVPEALL